MAIVSIDLSESTTFMIPNSSKVQRTLAVEANSNLGHWSSMHIKVFPHCWSMQHSPWDILTCSFIYWYKLLASGAIWIRNRCIWWLPLVIVGSITLLLVNYDRVFHISEVAILELNTTCKSLSSLNIDFLKHAWALENCGHDKICLASWHKHWRYTSICRTGCSPCFCEGCVSSATPSPTAPKLTTLNWGEEPASTKTTFKEQASLMISTIQRLSYIIN